MSKAAKKKGAAGARKRVRASGIKVTVSAALSKEQLHRAAYELTLAVRDARVPTDTAITIQRLLTEVADQLPPKRDRRIAVTPWLIAMVADILVKQHGAAAEMAQLAAIQAIEPSKENDLAFIDLIGRRYRELGHRNPARNEGVPGPALIELARSKLR